MTKYKQITARHPNDSTVRVTLTFTSVEKAFDAERALKDKGYLVTTTDWYTLYNTADEAVAYATSVLEN